MVRARGIMCAARPPSSQGAMRAIQFQRARGMWMSSGADSIDLGISTEFSVYTHTLGTNSGPSILAARGINKATSQPGWALMQYADTWNPWLGLRGTRATENDGRQAALGVANLVRWSYIHQGVHTQGFTNTVPPQWSNDSAVGAAASIRLFPPKNMSIYRSSEFGTPAMIPATFLGYPDGAVTNLTTVLTPIAVDYVTGVARPAIVRELSFHVGGAIDNAGDALRAWEGQLFGLATYREAHSLAQRNEVGNWMSWYHYRRCYPILTVNTVNGGQCNVAGGAFRDDYCSQTCAGGFAQTSGTFDHWCVVSAPHLAVSRACALDFGAAVTPCAQVPGRHVERRPDHLQTAVRHVRSAQVLRHLHPRAAGGPLHVGGGVVVPLHRLPDDARRDA